MKWESPQSTTLALCVEWADNLINPFNTQCKCGTSDQMNTLTDVRTDDWTFGPVICARNDLENYS